MMVLNVKVLSAFWQKHPDSRSTLERWLKVTQAAIWTQPPDVKATFGTVDPAPLRDGRKAMVFDIKSYRLIATIDYPSRLVSVLAVMTHAEYDRDTWKVTL